MEGWTSTDVLSVIKILGECLKIQKPVYSRLLPGKNKYVTQSASHSEWMLRRKLQQQQNGAL